MTCCSSSLRSAQGQIRDNGAVATISKRDTGGWQAKVRRTGYPTKSKTFATRADAVRWAAIVESELARGVFIDSGPAERTTIGQALELFKAEVVPRRRCQSSDPSRLRTLARHLGSYSIARLQPMHVANYRDMRLKTVGPESVISELNLLNRVLRWVGIEKGVYYPGELPTARVSKPKRPRGRERRVTGAELNAIIGATDSPEFVAIVRLAVATAMRRSELVALEWRHVDLERRIALLPTTKNGEPRRVPLSPEAVEVLSHLARRVDGKVFGLRPNSVQQAFQRALERARRRYLERNVSGGQPADETFLRGLHFHDLRHEATSRLFERGDMDLMEVALITGHKDLRMLQRYTHLRPETVALKLGQRPREGESAIS